MSRNSMAMALGSLGLGTSVLGGAAWWLIQESDGSPIERPLLKPRSLNDAGSMPKGFSAQAAESERASLVVQGKTEAGESEESLTRPINSELRESWLVDEIQGRIIDPQGSAIVDAKVCLSNASDEALAFSDNFGRFSLRVDQVEAHQVLEVRHPDYQAKRVSMPSPKRRIISVAPIELSEGARVTGFVFGPAGNPVLGAEVTYEIDFKAALSLLPERLAELRQEKIVSRTDDKGAFVLTGLPKGLLGIVRGRDSRAVGRSGALRFGEEKDSVIVLTLDSTAAIQGRVVGENGRAVRGALISASHARGGMAAWDRFEPIMSDDQGRFEIHQFAAGQWVNLFAQASGYSRTKTRWQAGSEETVVVTLLGGGTLDLQVQLASDVEVDALQVYLESSEVWERVNSPWTSNGPGRVSCQIDGLDAGFYRVWIRGRDQWLASSSSLQVKAEASRQVSLDLAHFGSVEGEVESPLLPDQVLVRLIEASDPNALWIGDSQDVGARVTQAVTTCDSKGRFQFSGIPEGKYLVEIKAKGFAETLTPPFTLVAGKNHSCPKTNLVAGGQIEGLIVDEGSGGGGVEVRVQGLGPDGPRYETISDADGVFILDRLTPGDYEVSLLEASCPSSGVNLDSHQASLTPKRVSVEGGKQTRVEFNSRLEGSLRGRVTLDGRAVPRAQVFLLSESERRLIQQPTRREQKVDSLGNFTISNLRQGDYVLEVLIDGRRFESPLTLSESERARLDVDLVSRTFHGTVVNESDGSALSGVRLRAGAFEQSFATDDSGLFQISGLFHDEDVIDVSLEGFLPQQLMVSELEGSSEVLVRLHPKSTMNATTPEKRQEGARR